MTLQEYNEHVHVLLTTGTPEAHQLLSSSLPARVSRIAPGRSSSSSSSSSGSSGAG
jgi:hypothetical protein